MILEASFQSQPTVEFKDLSRQNPQSRRGEVERRLLKSPMAD